MKTLLWLLVLLAIFFGLPLLAKKASFPSSVDPQELGSFIKDAWAYWKELFTSIFK